MDDIFSVLNVTSLKKEKMSSKSTLQTILKIPNVNMISTIVVIENNQRKF